jgi:ParB family transcriptional regulator, chromosome partitioning protein
LAGVLEKVGVFLDPIIAVRQTDGVYWTPNGRHRLEAMKRLGGRSVVALVLPDEHIAYQILALNTEKSHNLQEKSLEVVRMAQALADAGTDRTERDFAFEFEEPALVTLGICYASHPRFAGSQYHGILRATSDFLDRPLYEALELRRAHARRLVELDERVSEIVSALKERGFVSPYLKAFVVARCNPLRFRRGATLGFDEVMDRMLEAVATFDVDHVRPDQIARSAGPPLEEAA